MPPQRAQRTLLRDTEERSGRKIAVNDLKRTHRITWAAGDYASVAEHIDEVPPRDLMARAALEPGLEVLDTRARATSRCGRRPAGGSRPRRWLGR
jgi:hypothetical protein